MLASLPAVVLILTIYVAILVVIADVNYALKK